MSTVDTLLAAAGLKPTPAPNCTLKVRVLRIGPAEAAALLAANKDNRRLRPARVSFYAKVMRQAGWKLTHQGIAFDINGRGLDLQHRLHAIIEANVTIELMVVEGLLPEAFEAIDQHERRTIADALRIDRALADVARFMILVRGGADSNRPTVVEMGEVAAYVDRYHSAVLAACPTRRVLLTSAPARVAAVVLLHEQPALTERILHNYRILALAHSEEWPPAMHSLNRQILNGQVSCSGYQARLDLMARCLIALDPRRAALQRVQVDDDTHKATRRRVIGMLSAIDGAGNAFRSAVDL